MDEDEDILDAADGRSVHVLFRQGELVQRLADFPKEDELQTHLSGRYIKKEVAALSRSSAAVTAPSEDVSPSVKGRVGALVLERVETVNIYITITIVNGSDGDDPPMITVQSR